MQLNLRRAGQDSGVNVLEFFVDGRGARVHLRLRQQRHAQHAPRHVPLGKRRRKARTALGLEHRLQLLGRAGQQDDDLAVASHHGVDVLPRRAAIGVGHHLRAVDHVGLARIVLRHLHAPRGKALVHGGQNLRVAAQPHAQRRSRSLAREVVLGGAESAGEDHDVRALEGDARRAGQVFQVVADDGLEGHRDAQLVEPRRQVERVGVLPEGRQHLRPGGNNLSNHALVLRRQPHLALPFPTIPSSISPTNGIHDVMRVFRHRSRIGRRSMSALCVSRGLLLVCRVVALQY